MSLCGLLLLGLFGRRGRRRVAYAPDASALDLLDEERAALVLDRVAGAKYPPGHREQEASPRRVTRLFGELQVEAAVRVAHGEHAVEQVSAVRLLDDLLAHLLVAFVVYLSDDLFEQ